MQLLQSLIAVGGALVFDVSWVVLQNFLTEMALVDVHIDFCGADVLVPEHCLYCPEVGSALQKLCGEAMAEGVGADVLADARFLGIILDIDKQGYAAEVLAATK